jgi:hypothetical protein
MADKNKAVAAQLRNRLTDPITIFTGILCIVGLLQWCTLEKTDDTMRAGGRAFVFVKQSPGQWTTPRKIGNEIVHSWHIEWENSGNSQTKELILELYCVRPQKTSVADPISAYGKPTVTTQMSLGPKQTTWGGVCNYRAGELESIRTNEMHLYIGARATYFDIFDAPHVTEYCTEIIDLTGTFDDLSQRPDNRLRNCVMRNCADKECDTKK